MDLIPWRNKHRAMEMGRTTMETPLATLRTEIERLFNRVFHETRGPEEGCSSPLNAWTPAFDITEGDKEVTIRAEVPGVDPKNMELTVTGNMLTIAGEKQESSEERKGSTYRAERYFGRFFRRVELPTSVDTEKVAAEYNNGVLTIRMPRKPGMMPKRIPVNKK